MLVVSVNRKLSEWLPLRRLATTVQAITHRQRVVVV
jgi:hypothetical protein